MDIKLKHTQGPWEVKRHSTGGIEDQLWICGPKPPLIAKLNLDMKPHDQEANAKLIAAGPELLDIMVSIERYTHSTASPEIVLDLIRESAKGIIAKATS